MRESVVDPRVHQVAAVHAKEPSRRVVDVTERAARPDREPRVVPVPGRRPARHRRQHVDPRQPRRCPQTALHALPLDLELMLVRDVPPLAAGARPEVRAIGLDAVRRRLQYLDNPRGNVVATPSNHLSHDPLARDAAEDRRRLAVPNGRALAGGGEVAEGQFRQVAGGGPLGRGALDCFRHSNFYYRCCPYRCQGAFLDTPYEIFL